MSEWLKERKFYRDKEKFKKDNFYLLKYMGYFKTVKTVVQDGDNLNVRMGLKKENGETEEHYSVTNEVYNHLYYFGFLSDSANNSDNKIIYKEKQVPIKSRYDILDIGE